ncbi:MAG: FMN-binding negative transcriptional regulator [Burkholderiaceae bacterium]|jgi:transcriptional regulator|nr:FMN-binding negative transcriptional regulator [Burkholderiaceae bacterium]
MYLPSAFNAPDAVAARDLIGAHPFASLISNDACGEPFVTHLPLLLDTSRGDAAWMLLGHCALGNPHWRYVQAHPGALVTFQGPHAYLSPAVYPDRARVPSWNYLAVHCRVEVKLIEASEAKAALLERQIAAYEPAYAAQWRSLDEHFRGEMLAHIVGLEMAVTELQCKLKLNQHRPESHAALYAAYSAGNDDERALAAWMQRLGMKIAPD